MTGQLPGWWRRCRTLRALRAADQAWGRTISPTRDAELRARAAR